LQKFSKNKDEILYSNHFLEKSYLNFSLFYWLIISLQDLSPTGTLVRLLKHWYKEQKMGQAFYGTVSCV